MMSDDMALVREFSASHSELAFATLVQRHLGLVHSAALRQVGDAHLAEEIAQAVFLILARKAPSLGPKTILSAWLYRTTRYAAGDALKANRRRQVREQEAYMQSTLSQPDADTWAQLAPLLDDAMAELGETDRAALVLRFFENKTVGEIAGALCMEEAAAQKRVGRALEKLRVHFSKRGMALPAAALTAAISANAVQAAPVGLALTISTAAALTGTTLATATTATAIKTIAMTTLQKILITVVVAVSLGTPLLVQRLAQARMREQESEIQNRAKRLADLRVEYNGYSNLLTQTVTTHPNTNDQFNEVLKLRGEIGRLQLSMQELASPKINEPLSREETLASMKQMYSERVTRLKNLFNENPAESVPELRYLTDDDWLELVRYDRHQFDPNNSHAMSSARGRAQIKLVMSELSNSLRQYGQNNNNQFPTDISQLTPYFKSPVDNTVLQGWTILPTRSLSDEMQVDENWVITQKAPVNEKLDQRFVVGLKNMRAGTGTNQWAVGH